MERVILAIPKRQPPTQLDLIAGRAARDEAMASVAANAEPDWSDLAYAIGKQVAEAHPYFTSDDLWAAGLPKPREARALGPVINKLRRGNIIESEGYRQTAQVSRHAAPVRIWRSLVYVPRIPGGGNGTGGRGADHVVQTSADGGDAPVEGRD